MGREEGGGFRMGVHWKDYVEAETPNTLATSCEELTLLKRP